MKRIALIVPVLLFAASASAADVQATWDAVTLDEQGGPETVDHYVLYWGQTSRPQSVTRPGDPNFSYGQSQNVGNTTSSQQSGFNPGQTYYFAVAAVDTAGNTSAYSAEVTVVIPSDQDGGTDAGGQDAGGGDPAGADLGGEEEIVVEGGCGCGWKTPGTGTGAGTGTIILLLALLFIRGKRERY